jgi:hypothetical protein
MDNDDMAPPEMNAIADLELGESQVVNEIQWMRARASLRR